MGDETAVRDQAVKLYLDGMNLRRIGPILGVNYQSIANWVNQHANTIPDAPFPATIETAELDELFTFVGDKKHRLIHDRGRSHDPLLLGLGGGVGTQ